MRFAMRWGTRCRAGLLCAASACAIPALAAAQVAASAAPPSAAAASASPSLSMAQVIERLARQGFSDFREVERKGAAHFEVKARDAQRARVELLVDVRSGEIVKSKPDR